MTETEDLTALRSAVAQLDQTEKLALATNAIVAIDDSHTQLCTIQPKHGRYNENLAAAIGLLRHLSPGAKAKLAVEILSDDWDLGAAEDAPSISIE